jgi:hypothetical protein
VKDRVARAVSPHCRRLSVEDRELLLVAGVLVAMAGWLRVAVRITAWAWEGDGIWRASSTLTYPNAAAAVLVPLAVLAVARLVEVPRSMSLVVVAVVFLTGVGATLSRAAAAARSSPSPPSPQSISTAARAFLAWASLPTAATPWRSGECPA